MKKLAISLFMLIGMGVKAQNPQIDLSQFSSGYVLPVEVTNCGDSRLFVGEEAGKIWICKSNGVKGNTFLDISKKVYNQPFVKGFFGFTFHPDYLTNGYFYVYYLNKQKNTVVARYSVSPTNPNKALANSEKIILTIKQTYGGSHYGGCIRFGPDGYLYIGMGDGDAEGDPSNLGQNTNTLLGKMLRIDVNNGTNYAIPADNPFVSTPGYKKEIWAIGMRNPWRWSFDDLTGDLWLPDVGQDSLEEINLQLSGDAGGENYGWRCYEASIPYNTTGCANESSYTFPIEDYSHSSGDCAVIGGYVYRGSLYPNFYGKYIHCDYCTGNFRVIYNDGAWQQYVAGTFVPNTYVSFGEDMNKELFVVSQTEGKIYHVIDTSGAFSPRYQISSAPASQVSIYPNPAHENLMMNFTAAQNEEITISVCDLSGQVMMEFSRQVEKGMNQFPMKVQLASGNYLVVIHSANETLQKKIVIQ